MSIYQLYNICQEQVGFGWDNDNFRKRIEIEIFVIFSFRWMFDHYNSSRSCTARCTKTSWFLSKSKPSHPWFHWKYEWFYMSFVCSSIHNMASIIRYISNFITANWIRDRSIFSSIKPKKWQLIVDFCVFTHSYLNLPDDLFWRSEQF